MDTKRLYVGNLDHSVTGVELKELFSNYGEVDEVYIEDEAGFGFVEMSNISEADNAISELDGAPFKGRTMRVNKAYSQRG